MIKSPILPPFKRFCVTIGNLPSSYVDSMSYYECLMWLCKYLEDTVVPAVNTNAEAVTELQNYVANYFDNLDVQEEINNKLDDMADSGELAEIISSYLNTKALLIFDTVSDMLESENLVEGSHAQTLGFYSKNDGGGAEYEIISITGITPNDMDLIRKSDSLVAKLLYTNELNINQLGAKGDGETDNKNIIDRAISLLADGGKIIIPEGSYYTSGLHDIDSSTELTIKGMGKDSTKIILGESNYLFWCKNANNHLMIPVIFKDLTVEAPEENSATAFRLSDRWGYQVDNIVARRFNIFCEFYNYNLWTEGSIISNCILRNVKYGFTCNRNTESETATDSFFNIKILNCSSDLNVGNARLIYLKRLENQDYPINAYQWEVNATIWYGSTGGGKNVILVGDYNTLTGIFNITQDGTGNIYDGSDMNTIVVTDNGLFKGKGYINYATNEYSTNQIKFKQLLKQATNWKFKNSQPLAHLEGATIKLNGNVSSGSTASVIYSSGDLLPFSCYRVKVVENGDGGTRITENIVTTADLNTCVWVNNISGSNERRLNIRPKGGSTGGSYSAGNGLVFEVYQNATLSSDLNYYIEIEAL